MIEQPAFPRFLPALLLALAFLPRNVNSQNFKICQTHVEEILLNGNLTSDMLDLLFYHGPIKGSTIAFGPNSTARRNFTTITTQGCELLCKDPIDWYWEMDLNLVLSSISTWILPIIALLAALPYDSLHRRNDGAPWYQGRVSRTLGSLVNWLGSPQTALTATLWNIHQIRKCFHATAASGIGIGGDLALKPLKTDAYYGLSSISQFKIDYNLDKQHFLDVLAYGLFRPMLKPTAETTVATEMTTTLLQGMAFNLRMLRRRGVYPSFVSIFVFFIAYGVSLVLAFADFGEQTMPSTLSLGILVSWLPLLVLFTILDRNPISADRTRKLIGRWMWNVDAVRQWEHALRNGRGNDDPPAAPNWWSQEKEDERRRLSLPNDQDYIAQDVANDKDPIAQDLNNGQDVLFDDYIGEFVGQGRRIEFSGLTYTVLLSAYTNPNNNRQLRDLEGRHSIGQKAYHYLRRDHRPGSWYALALISLGLVWLEIGMAIMMAYNTPTVGLGCRSGSYIVYGFLSSLPWFAQLLPWFKHPGFKRKVAYQVVNVVSTLTLCFIIFSSFSGVFNNCMCKAGLSGYMSFEGPHFFRNTELFDVVKWWRGAAIVGALPLLGSFIAAILLLMRLKPLWHASEQQSAPPNLGGVDMAWLM